MNTIYKLIFTSFLTLPIMACNSDSNATKNNKQNTTENQEPAGILVNHKIIHSGEMSELPNKLKVLTINADYVNELELHNPSEKPKSIDFSKQRVVSYSVTSHHSGSTKLKIKTVYDDGDKVNVVLNRIDKGKHCTLATAGSWPYIFFTIDSTKEINFDVSNIVEDCEPKKPKLKG